MEMEMEVVNQLVGLNPTMFENLKLSDFQVGGTSLQAEFPATNYHFLPTTCSQSKALAQGQDVCNDNKMKKVMEPATNSSSSSSSDVISSTAFVIVNNNDTTRKNGLGKGNKGEIKLGEVIHVRAPPRGQATDSHSLAERVRRQRINSRFKRLQDIVPGCRRKTMGMAVMLDEIINYVQSLQNQVESLSMEVASASCSYEETQQQEKNT